MTICPAEPDTGIRFKRTDISGGQAIIDAHWRNVVPSQLCSAIANDADVTIKTIEHLMAAFAGLGVDNALVEINGPEVPIMDGSAAPFVFLIECAGIKEQDQNRRVLKVLKPVSVTDGDRQASIMPGENFSIEFDIEFESKAVSSQSYAIEFVNGNFKNEVGNARTFGFEHEVAALRQAGMLLGGSLYNAVVVSGDKILNDSGLRYSDEFVRHKILDSVGDLYLAGAQIMGHFSGSRSGHAVNHLLLKTLFADPKAWALVPQRVGNTAHSDVEATLFDTAPTPAAAAGR